MLTALACSGTTGALASSDCSLACAGTNKKVVCGGGQRASTDAPFEYFDMTNGHSAQSPASPLSAYPMGAAIAAYGNLIWLLASINLGGCSGSNNGYSTLLYRFDTTNNAWLVSGISGISQNRYEIAAVAANGFVFFAGGTWQGPCCASESGCALNAIDIFDIGQTKFTTVATLSSKRYRMAAAAIGPYVAFGCGVLGGTSGAGVGAGSAALDLVDTTTFQIAITTTAPGSPTGLSAMCAVGTKLVLSDGAKLYMYDYILQASANITVSARVSHRC